MVRGVSTILYIQIATARSDRGETNLGE